MQYIGDAKYGALKGTDQSASPLFFFRGPRLWNLLTGFSRRVRFGNRYFENLDPEEEIPGQQATYCGLSALVLMIPLILCRPPPMG
jgi:hypothetical protein